MKNRIKLTADLINGVSRVDKFEGHEMEINQYEFYNMLKTLAESDVFASKVDYDMFYLIHKEYGIK